MCPAAPHRLRSKDPRGRLASAHAQDPAQAPGPGTEARMGVWYKPRPMPLVPPYVASLTPYVPGKPIEEVEREYGVSNVAKLASNENALGPSPRGVEAARAAAAKVSLYPDGAA